MTQNTQQWNSAEDEYLLQLSRADWSNQRIARRLGRTPQEVQQRRDELRAVLDPTVAAEPVQLAPGVRAPSVTVERVVSTLSDMQRTIIEASAHHKALGDVLTRYNEHVVQSLQEVELADLLKHLLEQTRQPDETLPEKLARLLLQQFMVVPRTIQTPQ